MSTMKIRATAIKELEDTLGRVTARALVDAAKAKTHPMHEDFPWDDKSAADEHRLNLARQYISSVRTIVTTETQRISSVSYVRDPEMDSRTQGYVSVTKLRTEREAAQEALLAEVTRIQACLERGQELAFVLGLEKEFEAAMEAAATLKTRLRAGQPTLEATAQ